MLNPNIGKLINSGESRYRLVLDVAERAREISADAESVKEILKEKPVTLAIDEIADEIEMRKKH